MRIVLIGTGNVATRLGLAIHAKNSEIIQVFGRTEAGASPLAGLLECPFTTSMTKLASDADVYLLAVSDDAIPEVAASFPAVGNGLIVHTAGSVPMNILAPFAADYGVFYPLQTLSRQKEIDFGSIPVCIEANTPANLEKLRLLAKTISDRVVSVDSGQRRQLHLAAVFVCNFVNHFYSIGEELLAERRMDFNLLKPLILETAIKAMHFSPHTVQTGPAVRGNKSIMADHLQMLEQHQKWQQLYELISKDILNRTIGDGKDEPEMKR